MTLQATPLTDAHRSPPDLGAAVRARLAREAELPVLPGAAAELMSLMGSEDATAKQISDVVHRDQAIAAHVLRVANAPAYRGLSKIVSLQQAVARLGTRLLSEIALAISVKSVFHVTQHADLAAQKWQVALATGLVAKEIARIGRRNVEAAFLCGLLHDFGAVVVLRTALLEAKAQGKVIGRAEIEGLMAELGPDVGVRLAELWDLPMRVQAAIRHHRAFALAEEHVNDAALTALARAAAEHFLDPATDAKAVRAHDAVAHLNLYDDELDALLATREKIVQATRAVSA